jgi:hypothetical protein
LDLLHVILTQYCQKINFKTKKCEVPECIPQLGGCRQPSTGQACVTLSGAEVVCALLSVALPLFNLPPAEQMVPQKEGKSECAQLIK